MFEPFITTLRNRETNIQEFRNAAHSIANILAAQAVDHLTLKTLSLQTPYATTEGKILSSSLVFLPILRSGIAFLQAFTALFPNASIGFIGLKRDESTGHAHMYYKNFPPLHDNSFIIILDPTIATGGTALQAIAAVTEAGISQKRILFVSMIAARTGIESIHRTYPDITILCAAVDPELDKHFRIIPGLGDFGDRYFGTL